MSGELHADTTGRTWHGGGRIGAEPTCGREYLTWSHGFAKRDGTTKTGLTDRPALAVDRDGRLSSSSRRRVGVVSGLVVLVLIRTRRQGKQLGRATHKASRSEVRFEVLSEIIGTTEEFATSLDRALVRTLLCMCAIVTLEVFHPLEALAAVADVQLISRADDERRWTGIAGTASRRGARDRTRDTPASTVEQRSERAIVNGRAERDHAVASVTRHLRSAVVRVNARRHEFAGWR